MLKTNGHRDGFGSLKYFGAGINAASGAYAYVSQGNNHMTGRNRNLFAGEGGISNKSSVPAGARHPVAWIMAPKDGGMASHNSAKVELSQVGFAVLGLPGSGTSTITLDVPDATGGLVVSGSGIANISLTADGTILSIASGSGSATITLAVTDALIGAEAGISASGSITLTPTALISAVGFMSGLSTSETEFSATALANAVWQADAANYVAAGTMGEKLNDAGSASNPWTEVIESGLTAAQVMRLISSVLCGKVSGGGSGVETFRDIDDTKDRIIATVDSSGNRTALTYDVT